MRKSANSPFNTGDLFETPSKNQGANPPGRTSPGGLSISGSQADEPLPAPSRKVYSVAELTQFIRRTLEKQLGRISVTGEVTNFRLQSSGHIYFTLKDASAQLSCVLFRGEPVANRAVLQDGAKLILGGELTVYEPRGQYQLRVSSVELQGVGALQQEFERLKQKLRDEGLFAPERKRSLPRYPQRIGIVTSSSGAALRDVLHVVRRRQPGLEIIMASCRVQGAGAGQEIACAVRLLNDFSKSSHGLPLDLILVTRGGGSLEDLWAFNEEVVARAIFESALPVVSAVGHEIDFTISDFVADFRAATPSAAAEIITEGVFSSCQFVGQSAQRLRYLISSRLEAERESLDFLTQRLGRCHPRRWMEERSQYIDDLAASLFRCTRSQWKNHARNFQSVRQRLDRVRPAQVLMERRVKFLDLQKRFLSQALAQLKNWQVRSATVQDRLRLLSPQTILERGYSITLDAETGRVLRKAQQIKAGQVLLTRLEEGQIRSQALGDT